MTALGWLLAFAATQVIEMPIHARALRHRPRALAWSGAFMASTLTHPFVYLSYPTFAGMIGWGPALLIVESFAVLVEAAWLRRLGARDALLWALVANATSVAIASWVRALWR